MSRIHEANIEVHTRMADRYDAEEPHNRPENQLKVKGRLADLRARAPGGKLLDVGCGTGFVIHLAVDSFDEIHGVDITPAMMTRVKTNLGNITLHEAPAEELPFEDASFDAASAYSFIDHVADPGAVLGEVARVLRPGGVFYVDLAPNRLFWQAVNGIGPDLDGLSDIVTREALMVRENDKKVEEDFGIPSDVFKLAEPGKKEGGIDPQEFETAALQAGFSRCETTFDWFLGQGAVMHGQSFAAADTVEAYLRRAAPLTDPLFKYLMFMLVK